MILKKQMELKNTLRNNFSVPELNEELEELIQKVYGENWKNLEKTEIDGVLGLLMCKAILNDVPADLYKLSAYLKIDHRDLSLPYERLAKNGYMKLGRIKSDGDLIRENITALCYIAGIASGITGVGV